MIPTQQLLYKLDQRLNSLATNEHQEISIEDKILALREGVLKLIKLKLGSNPYGIGFEGDRKRYADLQVLINQTPKELSVSQTDSAIVSYYATLPDDLFIPLHIYVTADKQECTNRIITVEDVIPHSDVATYLISPHNNPSFKYQSTFAVISNNKLVVYAHNEQEGNFKINKVYLSYLRYPKEVDVAGFIWFNNSASSNQDLELPLHLEDELLDIVTQQLAKNTDNPNQVQYNQTSNF